MTKLEDEIPVTKQGLILYIKELEKAIKPVKLQYDRMRKLLDMAYEIYAKIK